MRKLLVFFNYYYHQNSICGKVSDCKIILMANFWACEKSRWWKKCPTYIVDSVIIPDAGGTHTSSSWCSPAGAECPHPVTVPVISYCSDILSLVTSHGCVTAPWSGRPRAANWPRAADRGRRSRAEARGGSGSDHRDPSLCQPGAGNLFSRMIILWYQRRL